MDMNNLNLMFQLKEFSSSHFLTHPDWVKTFGLEQGLLFSIVIDMYKRCIIRDEVNDGWFPINEEYQALLTKDYGIKKVKRYLKYFKDLGVIKYRPGFYKLDLEKAKVIIEEVK